MYFKISALLHKVYIFRVDLLEWRKSVFRKNTTKQLEFVNPFVFFRFANELYEKECFKSVLRELKGFDLYFEKYLG